MRILCLLTAVLSAVIYFWAMTYIELEGQYCVVKQKSTGSPLTFRDVSIFGVTFYLFLPVIITLALNATIAATLGRARGDGKLRTAIESGTGNSRTKKRFRQGLILSGF